MAKCNQLTFLPFKGLKTSNCRSGRLRWTDDERSWWCGLWVCRSSSAWCVCVCVCVCVVHSFSCDGQITGTTFYTWMRHANVMLAQSRHTHTHTHVGWCSPRTGWHWKSASCLHFNQSINQSIIYLNQATRPIGNENIKTYTRNRQSETGSQKPSNKENTKA